MKSDFDTRKREILESLERAYPGKLRLSVGEVANIFGSAKGTIYNQLSAGTCPIRFSRNGGRPRALIHDVAAYLAGE